VGGAHRREGNFIVLVAASKGADIELLGAQEGADASCRSVYERLRQGVHQTRLEMHPRFLDALSNGM